MIWTQRIFALLMLAAILCGCYYDNEETLYPAVPEEADSCNTDNVGYQAIILPLMETHCSTPACHSGNFPSANLDLTTYQEVKRIADDGSLFGTMAHESGFSPMPKNEAQLPECNINQVKAWIDAGAQNN